MDGEEDTSNLYPYQCYLWLKKKLIPTDAKTESKALVKLAWGICFNTCFSMFLPLSMLFAIGHVDKKSLAAAGLGMSICNLTGMVSAIGLTAACETLCSQAYGAGHFRRFGIITQRALVISTIGILPSCALWINTDKVLIAFGQDEEIAILAGQFTICYIPALFCFVLYNILVRYLACQKIVYPTVYGSLFAFLINGICCYLFIFVFKWGVRGGAFAIDVSFLSCCLFLLIFIRVKKLHTSTWHGWSLECLSGWKEFIYLALPCFGIVFVEWLGFELGIIFLGIIGRTEQASQIILYYLAGLIYFISYGISIAAAVRVGGFLGSGHPERAKRAMKVSIMITAIYTLMFGLLLIALKDVIAYLFTRDRYAEILCLVFTGVLPLLTRKAIAFYCGKWQ